MVRLFVTYMEQSVPPADDPLPVPIAGASVARETPDPQAYLGLYRAIGTPLQWDERLRMSEGELADFLTRASTAVYVLRQAGEPRGLCEFEALGAADVELRHFGLVPAAQGRRLGPYLLDQALRSVWSHGPERIWLHTDTNDHPAARPVYERAGFTVRAETWEEFPD
ncbi:MAG TPA: GNAT family N-acetyltransferase [Woeseiaceae bacterium]|nr:GNAT family N-acetyltransferase [Woeseiaceae bacterium]